MPFVGLIKSVHLNLLNTEMKQNSSLRNTCKYSPVLGLMNKKSVPSQCSKADGHYPCVVCRDGRVLGVLEVSRSIGDGQYKRCGVISTPDLRRCQLTASDR